MRRRLAATPIRPGKGRLQRSLVAGRDSLRSHHYPHRFTLPGAFYTVQWNEAREKVRKYDLHYEMASKSLKDDTECVLMYKVSSGEQGAAAFQRPHPGGIEWPLPLLASPR